MLFGLPLVAVGVACKGLWWVDQIGFSHYCKANTRSTGGCECCSPFPRLA